MNELRDKLATAAKNRQPVSGLTHNFYRYPARFSPQFAATAIECFSKPGDIVLDPYMGGGTTIVEALVRGRTAIGNDLNSLAAFITKVKVTPLDLRESRAIRNWAINVVPRLSYRASEDEVGNLIDSKKTKNLSLVRGRFLKKLLAGSLASVMELPTKDAQDFARCAILRIAQLALDGRRSHTSLEEFRKKLADAVIQMLSAIDQFSDAVNSAGRIRNCFIANESAANIDGLPVFAERKQRANLVVTSPPYPGIHILYHRWQVDGRRETPAPYWIAGCSDGQGASFYNFGDRNEIDAKTYFATSLLTLQSIRKVMASGGIAVQMIAFGNPKKQLSQYLQNMEQAGFRELVSGSRRIWRDVPNRRWHAALRGQTSSSREVVLIHEAI